MLSEYRRKMGKTIESLKTDNNAVRAGRANTAVLDQITVEYYGVETPINQVATVAVPDPRTITITPWDKTSLRPIEKAIQMSELGINPQNDGKMLRLIFPQLTEERRKELVRQVKGYGEAAKVAIRNIRRDAMDDFKAMKKEGELTEDDVKDLEKDLQKLTDEFIREVDAVTADKEKELFEI
ncbi:MAG: ribosome recycling factor [Oscillospiraceae bacterium]|nr:ribosome recycling factor [Oscillospiraceae bacterium]